ncbi:MAG: nitrilase [Hyphomonadaceae bacterium]|nr:nitrilase [Hyphomonadaceae bacterium]
MSDTPKIYKALALQTACAAVNRCTTRIEARDVMQKSLARIRGQLFSARAFHGSDLKLVCLPEYFLTGFPAGESAAEWREKAAVEMNGATYEAIAGLAADTGLYIAGNVYERDPNFPKLYFQATTLFSDRGELLLRYRRLISMYAPSPYDVWDRYIDIYGKNAVFPVADTPLGRLAGLASEEIRYPEITRILVCKGTEVLLHPSSEAASTQWSPKNVAKIARAQENHIYLVSANSAGITGTALAPMSTDARSQIIDDRGLILAETPGGESITACADIDIAALRYRRRRNGMDNMLARQPMALYADYFSGIDLHPPMSLGDGTTAPTGDFYRRRQDEVLEKLGKAGIV